MTPVLDHVGIAVPSLEQALTLYGEVLGVPVPAPEQSEVIHGQGVRVLMVDAGTGRLELLESISDTSPLAKFLATRGPGLHHLAFRVPDLRAALREAEEAGMELIDREPRIGFGGHKVAFVHPRSALGVLIEFCEEVADG